MRLRVRYNHQHFESVLNKRTEEPEGCSRLTVYHQGSGPIGILHRKRILPQNSQQSSGDLDWALCKITVDRTKIRLSNSLFLLEGGILCPKKIAQEDPTDMEVVIHTGTTGIVKGCIIGDYSLVALPGSKLFQRCGS
jgi:hypothetical protein